MIPGDIFADAFGRVAEVVRDAVVRRGVEELAWRPDADANSIAWLVWHLTRIQDSHVAELMQREEIWTQGGWAERFGLPFDPGDTGYGHRSDEVAQVRVDGELLVGYHSDVQLQTVPWVRGVREGDLGKIVDERWDPPVTLSVRLVSVIADCLQHAGQAAYLSGLLNRRSGGPVDDTSMESFPASDPPATY